jgi:3-isopropylmalate dehydrogenase
VGVLPGEGIGPQLAEGAVQALAAIGDACGHVFHVEYGGAIGKAAERECGRPLSAEVIAFCERVFARRGAVLAGPGGGRFVYDLRKKFDLFCKFSPLRPSPVLAEAGRLRPEVVRGVDIVVVRENVGGVYQGEWREERDGVGRAVARHAFSYDEHQVARTLRAAARLAKLRNGRLDVVVKDGGLPAISALWRQCAREIAQEFGVPPRILDVDHAAFRLIHDPLEFDVICAPNLFGDVLADLGAALLGSRAMSFSGNFSAGGAAVYQTNHGAAYDIAGRDIANPAGQLFALAMLLRESFGLARAADRLQRALEMVWQKGFRTRDIGHRGCCIVGTGELIARVVQNIRLAKEEPHARARRLAA